MHTRHLILKAILDGRKANYSISEKFAFFIVDNNLKEYVDTFGHEPKYKKIMDDIKEIGNELMVSFHGNGEPSDLKFGGTLKFGDQVEFYVPVDDDGSILYWKVRRI